MASAGAPGISRLAGILPLTAALLRSRLAAGRFLGAQVFAAQGDKVIADLGVGSARAGVPMTSATLNHWFCCTKPLVAIAIAQLVEKGAAHLDDPAGELIPSFGQGGKEPITIRHLLTHTAGLRPVTRSRPFLSGSQEIVDAVCAAPIQDSWKPGQRAAYVPFASWYVLGQIVERLSGESLSGYVRERIFEPLGLDQCWLGIPAGELARNDFTLGIPHAVKPGERPMPIRYLASPAALQPANPASGAIGPVNGLGMIFQSLLRPGVTAPLLSAATTRQFVSAHRVGLLDETYNLRWDWGLGFAVDITQLCAAVTEGFGHPGGSTLVFADRATDRVVALAVNGLTAWNGAPEVGTESVVTRIAQEIYRDLDET